MSLDIHYKKYVYNLLASAAFRLCVEMHNCCALPQQPAAKHQTATCSPLPFRPSGVGRRNGKLLNKKLLKLFRKINLNDFII